jgi:hypothetical protein
MLRWLPFGGSFWANLNFAIVLALCFPHQPQSLGSFSALGPPCSQRHDIAVALHIAPSSLSERP